MSNVLSFDDFFRVARGTNAPPFAWQRRLATQIVESDPTRIAWPDVAKLPTAAGKTGIILVALYALSVRPEAHRRIAYVVDRRIVADAGYDMMLKFKERLDGGKEPVLKLWASRVRTTLGLTPKDPVLDVHLLRGGLGEPLAKLTSPLTPTVIVSTVDQLGSRLLMRGYGSGSRAMPIAAGLLAYDTLWILDEAHISTAFSQTLASVRDLVVASDFPRPMSVIELTATPIASPKSLFDIGVPDIAIRPRLDARKLATIEVVDDRETLQAAFVREAAAAVSQGHKRIGIIVNRIRDARAVFHALRKQHKKDANVVLLIGPIRAYDRALLYGRDSVKALYAQSEPPEFPTVAVCTQTVEVGADLDFDTLLTQSAPIDVLRQRFGRLDRLGKRGDSAAVIVHHQTGEPDRIYGTALATTMEYLAPFAARGELDFGYLAFERIAAGETAAMRSEMVHAEPLVAPHVERLAQTWRIPYDSPDVAAFLHGTPGTGDVSICWRDHLTTGNESEWVELVKAAPPTSLEVLTVPIYAARAWLSKKTVDEADVAIVDDEADGEGDNDSDTKKKPAKRFVLLRYDGSNGKDLVAKAVESVGQIRPGDTIVVPSNEGGCDEFGWNPGEKDRVSDLSELAYFRPCRRARILIPTPSDTEPDEREDLIREALESIAENAGNTERSPIAVTLLSNFPRMAAIDVPNTGITWLTWRGKDASDDQPDSTSLIDSRDVTLRAHSAHVRDRALAFARGCNLPESLCFVLANAGWYHDLGKADLPFWEMLGRGVLGAEPLAKSRRGSVDTAIRLARVAPNFRHECVSVNLMDTIPDVPERELTRHLVGTHHGFGRPWFPICHDEDREVAVDWDGATLTASSLMKQTHLSSGWVEQFADLNTRFTPWGLAYLEAILRLADHRCSQDEEEGLYGDD